MPAIWNVNKNSTSGPKKLSSKLTFKVGEKFSGKLIAKGEGNEVVIRLSDGWQFTGELEGDFNEYNQGVTRFEVAGFKNGKLQLVRIKNEEKSLKEGEDPLEVIAEKEGLTKEDISLLKGMVKHGIPLTRENIANIKSIIQFNDKINAESDGVKVFIEKFIASKNTELTSDEISDIKNKLNEFFNSFKEMSSKDILTFLENNIEFTKENIDSFQKLFKGEGTIKEIFEKINGEMNKLDLVDGVLPSKEIIEKKLDINTEATISNKTKKSENSIASKLYIGDRKSVV